MNQDERDLRDAREFYNNYSTRLENGKYIDPVSDYPHTSFIDAFLAGITHERQRKAEEVEKGFKEWVIGKFNIAPELIDDFKYTFIHKLLHTEEAWTAATQLAEQKAQEEIEELKAQLTEALNGTVLKRYNEEKEYYKEREKQLVELNFELREDLEWTINLVPPISFKKEIVKIRAKYKLDE